MSEGIKISEVLRSVVNVLKLSDVETKDLLGYPDEALEYSLKVTIQKRLEGDRKSYFKGVLRQYCLKYNIEVTRQPSLFGSKDHYVKEEFFPHGNEEEEKDQYPVKKVTTFTPSRTLQMTDRDVLIRRAYPHLGHGEYDHIKGQQGDLLRRLSATQDKKEENSIKNQLYDLHLRIAGRL